MSRKKADGFTDKQCAILEFIADYIAENGYGPTNEEVARGTNRAYSGLGTTISNLKSRGLVGHRRLYKLGTRYSWAVRPSGELVEVEEWVFDEVSGSYLTPEELAERWEKQYREIPCLCCEEQFVSAHRFHRMCSSCRDFATEFGVGEPPKPGDYTSNMQAILTFNVGGFRKPKG